MDDKSHKANKLARQKELLYHGCGQSTLAAVQDVYNMDTLSDKAVFKACSEFRGGVGKRPTVFVALMLPGLCSLDRSLAENEKTSLHPRKYELEPASWYTDSITLLFGNMVP